MFIEVSIGEAIDKLNILELKMKKIVDEIKKKEIQKEINALGNCEKYKHEHAFYYNLLTYVNETIWDKTDIMKQLHVTDTNFAELSNDIFVFNQKRFRIKNWFNLLFKSNIKEQKSYGLSSCEIIINDEDTFYKKIPEINYLSLEYDSVSIVSSFNDTIKNIFKTPTIHFIDKDTNTKINIITEKILLNEFEITTNREIFHFIPLKYISGGLLGDFIHQLSVIKEKYYQEGRKGILYIFNIDVVAPFRKGLETAYADTYQLVIEQDYIKEYKIWNREFFDIDLSYWRCYYVYTSWDDIFYKQYNINWGKHKWLDVKKDIKWENYILVNIASYRDTYNINYDDFYKKYGLNILFVSFDIHDYIMFKKKHNIGDYEKKNNNFYQISSLYELCVAINSCKFFIGNFTASLAFAYAMHAKTVVAISNDGFSFHKGLVNYFPSVLIEENPSILFQKAIELFD
jgi:hypothetical protein